MISGNGVPAASDCDEGVDPRVTPAGKLGRDDESQPLRYIQNLIARLEVVNRQLSLPVRTRPAPRPEETVIPEVAET